MSFRIDLAVKDGMSIFLVVVRDTININFTSLDSSPKKNEAEAVRENFMHLAEHFKMNHRMSYIRGQDPVHIKRHHVYAGEEQVIHLHIPFDSDVTPCMLKQFLIGILSGQKTHASEEKYQFIDKKTADFVLQGFTRFYNGFVKSEHQRQFLEERLLTRPEMQRLASSAANEVGVLSIRDKKELKQANIPIPDKAKPEPQKIDSSLINRLFSFFFEPTKTQPAAKSKSDLSSYKPGFG